MDKDLIQNLKLTFLNCGTCSTFSMTALHWPRTENHSHSAVTVPLTTHDFVTLWPKNVEDIHQTSSNAVDH